MAHSTESAQFHAGLLLGSGVVGPGS